MTKCSSYCFQILYCKPILFAAILFCSFLGIYWLGVVKFCNTSSGNGTLDFQTIYTHTHYKAFKIVWFTHLYLKKQKQTKQYLGKPFSDYKLRRLEQIFLTNERFFVLNFFYFKPVYFDEFVHLFVFLLLAIGCVYSTSKYFCSNDLLINLFVYSMEHV